MPNALVVIAYGDRSFRMTFHQLPDYAALLLTRRSCHAVPE